VTWDCLAFVAAVWRAVRWLVPGGV
jgi:hypothetical protein